MSHKYGKKFDGGLIRPRAILKYHSTCTFCTPRLTPLMGCVFEKGGFQGRKKQKVGVKCVTTSDLMCRQKPLRSRGDRAVISYSSPLSMPSLACLNSDPGAVFSAPTTTADLTLRVCQYLYPLSPSATYTNG